MKLSTVFDLPSYGESGAYAEGELADDAGSYVLSTDLNLFPVPVPGHDEEWPTYIWVGSDTGNVYEVTELLGPVLYNLSTDEYDHGSPAHLRHLADTLENSPEFHGAAVAVAVARPRI